MRPAREIYRKSDVTYFVSTQTAGRKPFFRHDRWARLMRETLLHYAEKDFHLHAYVIMPDHLHLLITPADSVERAVQLIKGGFSFRAKRELEWKDDIWQPGFTDHRIRDEEDWKRRLEYIRSNPLEARLGEDPVLYEYIGLPSSAFPQGLKPRELSAADVRAKARTLQTAGTRIPQGLKPGPLSDLDVRPEGRTLQPEARILQTSTQQTPAGEGLKGTGFSLSVKAAPLTGAFAPEGMERGANEAFSPAFQRLHTVAISLNIVRSDVMCPQRRSLHFGPPEI